MQGKSLMYTFLFTGVIDIIRLLVIKELTKVYQGSADLPDYKAQESYYVFPWSE